MKGSEDIKTIHKIERELPNQALFWKIFMGSYSYLPAVIIAVFLTVAQKSITMHDTYYFLVMEVSIKHVVNSSDWLTNLLEFNER